MHYLKAQDRQFFEQQGYLLPQLPIFEDQDFSALKACFEGICSEWQEDYNIRPEHIDVPHLYHPQLYQWLCNERLLDIIEDLIGPDIALFSSHFICKPANTGQRVPWHEDSAYWAHYDIDPMNIVTLWLAIDDSSTENGCMQVIPQSHLQADSQYHDLDNNDHSVFGTEIDSNQFDENTAVNCILKENHASFHHAKCIHGSLANESNKRRCGYTMRYMSTRCKINNIGDHHIFLVRGKAHADNQYSELGQVLRQHEFSA